MFPKNPKLRDFLTSGPAAAAGIYLQHGFEVRHSRDECHAMIERYAALGGDGGLTEDSMRLACGLQLRDRRTEAVAGGDAPMLLSDSQEGDERAVYLNGLQVAQSLIITRLMKDSSDHMTSAMFGYVTLSKEVPNMEKDKLWNTLCSEGLMLPAHFQKTKGMPAMFPAVKCKNELKSIFDTKPSTHPHSFPETYNVAKLSKYLYGHPSRQANVTILSSFYKDYLHSLAKKKGKKSNKEQALIDDTRKLLEKLEKNEEHAEQLLTKLAPSRSAAASSSDTPVAKRKLARKTSGAPTPASQEQPLVEDQPVTCCTQHRSWPPDPSSQARFGKGRGCRQFLHPLPEPNLVWRLGSGGQGRGCVQRVSG